MIIINGRFLTQGITGVQRFAYEIVLELDKKVKQNQVKIIVPKCKLQGIKLENIVVEEKGMFKGQLWEQLELPKFIKKKDLLLNLCNTAPLFKTGIVTIHDISTKVNPKFYNWKFKLWYCFMNIVITKTSKKILTVSEFSKREIIKHYKVKNEKIGIIYNGWQHLKKIKEDDKILKELKLEGKAFYLGVSSLNPNKNFNYIIKLAKKYPSENFIVVGKMNRGVFGESKLNIVDLNNITFTGYINDEMLKALYKDAKFFIFPSFYEGFGIPPLEAMACGTQVVISNTSSLPEIFGESANYLNPFENELELNSLKLKDTSRVLKKYSWEKSVVKLLNFLKEI